MLLTVAYYRIKFAIKINAKIQDIWPLWPRDLQSTEWVAMAMIARIARVRGNLAANPVLKWSSLISARLSAPISPNRWRFLYLFSLALFIIHHVCFVFCFFFKYLSDLFPAVLVRECLLCLRKSSFLAMFLALGRVNLWKGQGSSTKAGMMATWSLNHHLWYWVDLCV